MSNAADPDPEDLCTLLQQETDFGVLRLMADRDLAWANAAFHEFYNRHKDYLWVICADVAGKLSCDAWKEDVFRETFKKAYFTAGKFEFPTCSAEEEDPIIKGWLGTIAQRMLCDRYRQTGREQAASEEQWAAFADNTGTSDPFEFDEPQEPAAEDSARLQVLEEAMNELSEREAHVLRVTSQFHRLGRKYQRLPNRVVDELAKALSTSPENLRKIRERAKNKVRLYMEARGHKFS